MQRWKGLSGLLLVLVANTALATPPTQVVYRFDEHRYLELTGFNCEGELWYTDMQRGIHSQIVSQFYRIFTRRFVHPSARYISITGWGAGGFMVSKDYGQTWHGVSFSPGPNEPDGMNQAPEGDAIAFTVVNDQGFLQTKHSLYMSSKPFEDSRVLPGGPGIHYTLEDGKKQTLEALYPGWPWGMVYYTKRGLKNSTQLHKSNWQNLPDQVPEVKDYKGWDHMRCDMDAGK